MAKLKKIFTLKYLLEPIEAAPSFATQPMFGGLIVWYQDRQVLCLMESPGDKIYREVTYSFDLWNGILIPTFREHHESLVMDFPNLVPHPVLGKWLYLPLTDSDFESTAERIIQKIKRSDPRFGIPILPKKKKNKRRDLGMNLGPKSKKWLAKIGLTEFKDLKKAGWKKTLTQLHEKKITPANVILGYALYGAIHEKDWRSLNASEKLEIQNFVKKLRT